MASRPRSLARLRPLTSVIVRRTAPDMSGEFFDIGRPPGAARRALAALPRYLANLMRDRPNRRNPGAPNPPIFNRNGNGLSR